MPYQAKNLVGLLQDSQDLFCNEIKASSKILDALAQQIILLHLCVFACERVQVNTTKGLKRERKREREIREGKERKES